MWVGGKFQDGSLGIKGPLLDPYLGPKKEGLIAGPALEDSWIYVDVSSLSVSCTSGVTIQVPLQLHASVDSDGCVNRRMLCKLGVFRLASWNSK